jgi:lipoprotein-anchoring transpeptidase ErfK/SrfK
MNRISYRYLWIAALALAISFLAAAGDPPAPEEAKPARESLREARNLKQGYHIVIEKGKFLLSLYKDGDFIKSYPVAVGQTPTDKKAYGDRATPEGWFNVKYINKSGTWTHDYEDGKGQTSGAYGPWFIALSTTAGQTFSGKGWTGIGIHGTNRPDSIGKYVSGGCIRLHNKDVVDLKQELDSEPFITAIQVDILP